MSGPLLALVMAVLLLSVGSLSAHAATFYVSTAGNNSVTCAQAQSAQTPRRTINAGIACLAGGDTLIVKAGRYDEIVTNHPGIGGYTVPVPSGGSWATATTLKADPPGSVVLTVSNPPSEGSWEWPSIVEFDSGRYRILDGFILDGGFRVENGIGLGGDHMRVSNSEIRNAKGQGIQGEGSFHEFINLHVHHIALNGGKTTCSHNVCGNPSGQMCPGYCHAIYLSGEGNLVDGGSWHDNDGHAIHYYPAPSNGIVRNALIYNNEIGIGIYGPGHQIYNNVLLNNKTGIKIPGKNTVAHNTIYGTSSADGFGIYQGPSSVPSVIKNNLILRQAVNSLRSYIYVDDGPNTTLRSGNVLERSVDPTFVAGNLCDDPTMLGCAATPASPSPVMNASAMDLHLCAGSPAIAAGVHLPDATLRVDKDGAARPPTGAVDVGAYQYVSGTPTLPAPSNLRVKAP